MNKLLVLLLACMWSYEHDLNGQQVALNLGPPEMYLSQFQHAHGSDYWENELFKFRNAEGHYSGELTPVEKAFRNRNDEAVALAHLSRAKEALQILKALEKESPGRYEVAANLGTSYELAGDDLQALEWISTAIKRNPDSHQGTEWLHQNILEAKLKLKSDPHWLESHSILGYDFGTGASPVLPAELQEKSAQERAQRALEYQLGERLAFVQAPDPVVADLLVSLAYTRALTTSAERGRDLLKFALTYQPARRQEAERRLQSFERSIWTGEFIGKVFPGLFLVFIAIFFFRWLRRR